MSEWKEYLLTEITSKIGDGLHGTPQYKADGEYFFINGNNLVNGRVLLKNDTNKVSEEEALKYSKPLTHNSILLSINGTIGSLAIYNNEKCMLGKSVCYINTNELVETKYLYYNFLSKDFQNFLDLIATGTTIPNVPLKGIREYTLKLPPLSEQKAIAEVLSSLDDKIDLLHRNNKTLEQMAETLFRQWFVVEAKDEWEEKKVSDIIEIRDGTHDSPKQAESGRYLVTSKNLRSNEIDFSTAYKISEADYHDINKRSLVEEGDILISMIGTLGLLHLVVEKPDYAIKNIGLFKSSQKPWFSRFLLLLLKSPVGKNYIYENADGSTQEYISLGSLRKFSFNYPGEERIRAFDNQVEPILNKVKHNSAQIRSLSKTRDTLLPKLMSGQVKVNI